jgi:16S rRNA (guanine966-N2)-methyltransferase
MRVITGRFKGRQLQTVRDLSVRPATDRVKKTIFDMLATRVDLDGARVLDLFAGSGALGFEALSRGASHVTFVENARDAAGYIERNAETFGCLAETLILETDALAFARSTGERFDLIFADPPYAFPGTAGIPGLIFERTLLHRGGYLVIEHAADLRFPPAPAWQAGPEKKFGRTLVTFFRHPDRSAPPHTAEAL